MIFRNYRFYFLFLLVALINNFKGSAQDPIVQTTPQDLKFGLAPDNLGAMSKTVNLFTGEVNLPVNLVSLANNNLNVDVTIAYSSAGKNYSKSNLDAPTGILGLGWSMSFPKITVNNKGTGARDDDEFFLTDAGSSNQLIPVNVGTGTEILFKLEKFKAWKISYFPTDEKWVIIKDDGIKYVYGDKNTGRSTVQYIVKWGNWIGASARANNGTTLIQQNQAVGWNLAEIGSTFDQKTLFTYLETKEAVGKDVDALFFTKASYLKTITDEIGRTVNFVYADKLSGDTFSSNGGTYKEFQDPNIEAAEPDAYQEVFEDKYLQLIEVKTGSQKLFKQIKFAYELKGTGEAAKRLLTSISEVNDSNEEVAKTKFAYIENNKKLETITYASGATIKYTYGGAIIGEHDNGALLGLYRGQKINSPTATNGYNYADPDVKIGKDYVIVTWRQVEANGDVKTTPSNVIVDAYLWDGRWFHKRIGNFCCLSKADMNNDQYWNIKLADDYFVITTQSQDSNFKRDINIYSKNKNEIGGWVEFKDKIDLTITTSFTYSDRFSLLMGEHFVAIHTNSLGTIFTYILDNNEIRKGSQLNTNNFSAQYYAAAANNYIISHNQDGWNTDVVTLYYLDKFKVWHSVNFSHSPNTNNNVSKWLANKSSAIALLAGDAEYIYNWDENYSNLTQSPIGWLDDNSVINAQSNSLFALTNYAVNNGQVNIEKRAFRFDGYEWKPIYHPLGENNTNTSFGDDFLLWHNQNYTYRRQFNPNTYNWDTEIATSVNNKMLSSNLRTLFFNCTLWNRNPNGQLTSIFNLNCNNVTNNWFEFGQDKAVFQVDPNNNGNYSLEVRALKNGNSYTTGTIAGHKIIYSGKDPASLVKNNIIVSSTNAFSSFHQVNYLYLDRYLDNGNSSGTDDLTMWWVVPVVDKVEVWDGYETRYTSFDFDRTTARMDAEGISGMFNNVKVYEGTADKNVNLNGYTEHYFHNGFKGQTLLARNPAINFLSDSPDQDLLASKFMLGTNYAVLAFNNQNELVSTTSTTWQLKNNEPVIIGLNDSNGESYFYRDQFNRVVYVVNSGHDIEGYNVNKETYIKYASEAYSEMLDKNMLTPIAHTYTEVIESNGNAAILSNRATTYKDWGGGKFAIHKTYAANLDFNDPSFNSNFYFSNWYSGEPGNEWQKTSEVLSRTPKGNISSSVGLDGFKTATAWGDNDNLPTATFRNAEPVEVFNEDFNQATDFNFGSLKLSNPNNWFSNSAIGWQPFNGTLTQFYNSMRVDIDREIGQSSDFVAEFDMRLNTLTDASGFLAFTFNKTARIHSPYQSGLSLNYFAGSLNLSEATGSSTTVLETAAITPSSQWRRFRIVREMDLVKVYLDGVFVLSSNVSGGAIASGKWFGFFCNGFSMNNKPGGNGAIDNLRIYPIDAIASSTAYEKDFKVPEVAFGADGIASRALYDQFHQPIVALKGLNTPINTSAGSLSTKRNNGSFNSNDPNVALSTTIRGKDGIYEDFSTASNTWARINQSQNGQNQNGASLPTTWEYIDGKLVNKSSGDASSWVAPAYVIDLGKNYQGRVGVEFSFKYNKPTPSNYFDFSFGAGDASWIGDNSATGCALLGTFNGSPNLQTHSGGYWQPVASLLEVQKTYRLKVILNTETQKVDYYLDGKLVKSDMPFRTAVSANGIRKFSFFNYDKAGEGARFDSEWVIDNLVVYSDPVHSVAYTDAEGKVLQQQQELPDNKILVNETLYDRVGNLAAQVKPTVVNSRFAYQPNFVTYFDATLPLSVINGDANTLNNNDDYPFNRTLYELVPGGRPIEMSIPGNDYRIGSGHTTIIENGTNSNIYIGANSFSANSVTVEKRKTPDGKYSFTYSDLRGRTFLTKLQDNDGTPNDFVKTEYEYDIYNNLIKIFAPNCFETPSGQDPNDFITTMSYDYFGRLKEKNNPDAGTTRYIYDKLGRLRYMMDANGAAKGNNQWERDILYFDYDEFGRISEEGYIPLFEWDEAYLGQYLGPNLKVNSPFASSMIWRKRFTYGNYPIGTATMPGTVFEHNALLKVEVNNDDDLGVEVEETFAYDAYGNLLKKGQKAIDFEANSTEISYSHDNLGTITRIDYGANTIDPVIYKFDLAGRPLSVGNDNSPNLFASYTYNKNGSIDKESLNRGGINRQFGYNAQGRLASLNNSWLDPLIVGFTNEFTEELHYNISGTISDASYNYNWNNAPTGYRYDYTYDVFGQLVSADNSYDAQYNFAATYDRNGNILTLDDQHGSKNYTYDLNKVTNAGGNFNYDANGNVIWAQGKGLTFSYDPFTNMATQVARAALGPGYIGAGLQYGANNQRVLKSYTHALDGETPYAHKTYYVHGGKDYPLIEKETFDNGGAVQTSQKYYVHGATGLLAIRQDNQWQFPIKDHLGSTRVLVNDIGSVVASYDYTPFGGLMRSTVGSNTNYKYTGQEFDEELGLQNYRARFYDPELGRFYGVDPMEEFHNPYEYVGNNPVSNTDPTGMQMAPGAPPQTNLYDLPKQFYTTSGIGKPYMSGGVSIREMKNRIEGGEDLGSNASASALANLAFFNKFGANNMRDAGFKLNSQGQWTYTYFEKVHVDAYKIYGKDDYIYNQVDVVIKTHPTWQDYGNYYSLILKGDFEGAYNYDMPGESIPVGFPSGSAATATVNGIRLALNGSKSASPALYTVYKGITANGGVYWGMTKNFAQRSLQHGDKFVKITEEYVGITSRGAARGIEQLSLDAAGGIGKLVNKINSIGIGNPNLMNYYQEAVRFLNK